MAYTQNSAISSGEFPVRRESRDSRGSEKVESASQALSFDWHALTGRDMPRPPLTAEAYNARNLPWFEWYDEGQAVSRSPLLAKVKSVGELDKEIAEKDKNIPDPTNVVPLKAKAVKDGEW